jgi:hypothetical protein
MAGEPARTWKLPAVDKPAGGAFIKWIHKFIISIVHSKRKPFGYGKIIHTYPCNME